MSTVLAKLESAKWRVDSAHALLEQAHAQVGDASLVPLVSASKQLVRILHDAIADEQKKVGKP